LADGWGEKMELQIPRFARDDNQGFGIETTEEENRPRVLDGVQNFETKD
jgi:hypothetical protein